MEAPVRYVLTTNIYTMGQHISHKMSVGYCKRYQNRELVDIVVMSTRVQARKAAIRWVSMEERNAYILLLVWHVPFSCSTLCPFLIPALTTAFLSLPVIHPTI